MSLSPLTPTDSDNDNDNDTREPIDNAVLDTEPDEHSDLAPEAELQFEQVVDAQGTYMSLDDIGYRLAEVMNHSPFVAFTGIRFAYDNGEMIGRVEARSELVGNTNFNILHGGMSATILDTIGGLVGMFEIYKRHQGTFEEQTKKVKRLATVDLRVDYLAPGRGKAFIATAEVIRIGRKGCTTRMMLVNDEGKPIAHGIASYAF